MEDIKTYIGYERCDIDQKSKKVLLLKKHRQALLEEKKNDWKYLPNRMIKKLLGEKIYLKIKGWIRYDNG